MQMLSYLGEVTFKKLGNLGHRNSRSTKDVPVFPPNLPGFAEGRMEVSGLHHLSVVFVVCLLFRQLFRV